MSRPLARELAIVALFVVVAVVMTWPLAVSLDRAISDPGDPYFTTWALDWNYHALTTHASLFDANIFYPEKNTLAFSENMAGIALFLIPAMALGVAPLTAHNAALLLGFAACAYAMYLLARRVTGSTAAGVVAGFAYGFVGFRFHHLPHLHFVWSMWLPILLLLLLMLAERPGVGVAIALTLAIVVNALTSAHWLVFGAAATGITAVAIAIRDRRFDRRFWLLLAASHVAAALLLLPFLLPYREVRKAQGTDRRIDEVYANGAEWRDLTQPYYRSLLYGRFASDDAIEHERTLFPGVIVFCAAAAGLAGFAFRWRAREDRRHVVVVLDCCIALAAAALLFASMAGGIHTRLLSFGGVSRPLFVLALLVVLRIAVSPPQLRTPNGEDVTERAWHAWISAVVWIAVGILGARGLKGFFHSALYDWVPLYRGIRMPGRWIMIAYVGLALAAALFVARFATKRGRVLLATVMTIGILAESWIVPARWYMVSNEPHPVYDWLATAPISGGVLELPLDQSFTYEYMWHATRHHRPLLNGVSSYTPKRYQEMADLYAREPIPNELLDALERNRCSLIVVHDGLLRERSLGVRDWLRRGIAKGRLTFVRQFAEGGSADFVFAVLKNEPRATALRAPETPDAEGRTPIQNADAFLHAQWTFVNGAIMRFDHWPSGTIRGPLTVSGWVTAPYGIREIRAVFANGRRHFIASRSPRPDVAAMLPWHPNCAQCGFAFDIPAPPEGIDGDTGMQIEIVKADGGVVRKPSALFAWRKALASPPRWKDAELDALLQHLHAPPDSHQHLAAGSAAIQDFIAPLISAPEEETDVRFCHRAVETLLGANDAAVYEDARRELIDGVSRRRVIESILTSRAFAEKYVDAGRVTID